MPSSKDEKSLEALKEDVLARVAHDLRNSLGSCRGYAEMLLSDADTPERKRAARSIMASAQFSMRLLDDLLDAAAIREGKFALERRRAPLADIVRETVEAFQVLAQARGVRIRVGLPSRPALFSVDPERIRQVLGNLISNALKSVAPGGKVTVMLRATAKKALLAVADDGMGIAPANRDKLFKRFSQAHRARPGLGLGLHICRAIVEGHGGQIAFQSGGEGKGAVFYFTLPAGDRPLPRAVPAPAAWLARLQPAWAAAAAVLLLNAVLALRL